MNLYMRVIRLFFKILFSKKGSVWDQTVMSFRAWPHDIDLYFHMTNARYPAMMDLGRTHLLGQAGVIRLLLKHKYLLVPISSEFSFIREIKPFQKFNLHTQLITWDENYWFVDQKFISGDTLHAHATIRGLVLKRGKRVPFTEVLDLIGEKNDPPEMPERIIAWQAMLEEKKKSAEVNS